MRRLRTDPDPDDRLLSVMVSARGTPGDAPPLPWGRYLLALIGFPFRQRKIWDDDPAPDPRERDPRRPT